MFEERLRRRQGGCFYRFVTAQIGDPAFAIELGQLGNLPAVAGTGGKSKLFFERLLQNLNVLVLAEDQRDYEPIISCAHLSVGSVKAFECSAGPARNVGSGPAKLCGLGVKGRSLMTSVAGGQKFSSRDWLDGLTDEDAVHYDWRACSQVGDGKLVLGGNVGLEEMLPCSAVDELALLEIGERDHHVVAGIELEGAGVQS